MGTPARNNRTLRLRELGRIAPRIKMPSVRDDVVYSFDDTEEVTRPAMETDMAKQNAPTVADPTHGLPLWVKIACIVVPLLTGAIAQLISVLK